MIVVEGWVRMDPAEIERLRPAAVEMMRATRANEPGCLEYAYAADLADSGLLRVIERWENQAALDAHFQTEHMVVFNAAMAGAKITGASVKAYDGASSKTLVGE